MNIQEEDDVPVLIDASDELVQPQLEDKRVPITLICGFLGAGKSTLLKRILTERHGYRIAVIMNEFGDTADIEAKAIKIPSAENPDNLEQASEEFLELANGCLCCSIKDTGVAAIEKLMSRKGVFDHILLETTGLADPGPIAAMFWQNEEFSMGLGKDIYLDGVICVVDAFFAEKQIQEDTESDGIKHSLRQIAAADVLLLNKSDLISEADLVNTESTIRLLNPSIPIYRTVRAQIPLSKVMGIDAYSEGSRAFLNDGPRQIPGDGHEICSDNEHIHGHEEHLSHGMQHAGISSIIANVPGPLSESQVTALDEWIRSVLWDNSVPRVHDDSDGLDDLSSDIPRLSIDPVGSEKLSSLHSDLEILRCKGIWWNERGEEFMLQGVRNIYEVSKLPNTALEMDTRAGKLVFIGKGLNKTVEHSLRRLVTDSSR